MRVPLRSSFSTLRMKIAFIVVVASMLTTGAFLLQAHRTGYSLLEDVGEAKAYSVAGFGKALLEHLMLEGKSRRVHDVLTTATSFPQIRDALILRQDGTIAIRARTHQPAQRFDLADFHASRNDTINRYMTVTEDGVPYAYILSAIEKNSACYRCHTNRESIRGYFVVKIATDDLQSIAQEHRSTNIVMTILSFGGLAGVTFLALSWVVVFPIRKLHSHIKHVERQIILPERGEHLSLPTIAEQRKKDEIGDLSRAFNGLVKRLNEANTKLQALHLAQLEKADRIATVGEMAASLAHEIKNPVAGVLGALQVFDSETAENDPRKELLGEMMTQLNRINQAVNDLLSYARPTFPVYSRININDVIEKTVLLISQQLTGKTIDITLNLTATHGEIIADMKMMQQLFWNLASNGLQAMGTSGTLTCSTSREDSVVTIEIRDTGPGIPPENLERVFQPFFTTKHKGTGLGLAICKRIVEQHRGTIEIASLPGKGTTVIVTLPTKDTIS